MKKILTSEERLSATRDLLGSLHQTIRRLRHRAEMICENLQERDETEIGDIGKKVAAVDIAVLVSRRSYYYCRKMVL